MNNKLLLIDGHAYAYRAFYAIRNLKSPSGAATNAIYGFIKMLGRMRELLKPTHLVVVWDGGLSEERVGLVPEYKAQRPEMPDDLSTQIEEIGAYLDAAGIAEIHSEGVEADDWIATLARQAVIEGIEVVIASSDKDFFQLVNDKIGMLNPGDKMERVWFPEEVEQKTGVKPDQIVDWLSLIGDAVDNISGVQGVGPKTATDLMRRFSSVDGLYARIDEVESGRIRTALQAAEAEVRRNQKMIRLNENIAIAPPITDFVPQSPNFDRLLQLARSWGFKGMTAEIESKHASQPQLFAV